MASQAELEDPLYNLRLSQANGTTPILSTSADTPSAANATKDIAQATHITFNNDNVHKTFNLSDATRFAPLDQPLTLRSVYFAYLNKDATLPDYLDAVRNLNEELPSGAGGSIQNLALLQRIELISWLQGEIETTDSLKALDAPGVVVDAEKSAAIASGKIGGVPVEKGIDGQKRVDERLMQIYDGERKMGDHNSVLRGSKPMDFTLYRKTAQSFLRSRPSPSNPSTAPSHTTPLVSSLQKKPRARAEPIILLSPSASSLLRMSNIKSFLDDGVFIPPNNAETTLTNLLQLTRTLPSISSQPIRFFIVDGTQNFKPTYWARVVAIFTTGQTWQFKSYKYPNPAELFSHYPGVHVGWQGEDPPPNVQAWGRGVLDVKVDKWTGQSAGRWRDREVVETIWGRIEEFMRRGGWTREGPPAVTTR